MADFVKTEWVNGAAPGISAQELNRMEQGIYDVHHPSDALLHATIPQVIAGTIGKVNFNWEGPATGRLWDATNKQLFLANGSYLFELQVYCDDPSKIQKVSLTPGGSGTNASYFDVIGPPPSKYVKLSGFLRVLSLPPGAKIAIWPEIATTQAGVQISGQIGATYLHVVKLIEES